MKILSKEIDFDFFDAKQMEIYEKESEIASKKITEIIANIKNLKQSEMINKTFDVIENCFNNIFGENISKEIFEGKRNLKLCFQAFKDLVAARKEQENEVNKEAEELNKELKSIGVEYKPNRATRRGKK
ncbi:MAG TPA: AP endonuclease [Clostridiaceae bacterium]|jgi:hypothetical protein|nr:MAG TPA: tail assembly chaperone protein [Caudoviricetes sp.]HJJ11758.1 AP endonuclease [Clostridiaceae bacterium]